MKPNVKTDLVGDWRTDCPFPNTDALLVYKYGLEMPRWTLGYTITGAKHDIRLKMYYEYSVKDPYYFAPPSHPEAWFTAESYAEQPSHLTWDMIRDIVKAVGECTMERNENRAMQFHVVFGSSRVASGELGYLPADSAKD